MTRTNSGLLANSDMIAAASGLSTALCIGRLSDNMLASAAGGMAVYCALSMFKYAMREIVREISPRQPENVGLEAAKPAPRL